MLLIERLESKLQINSFTLQLMAGLGFSFIAIFILWNTTNYEFDASLAIGVFFGVMAQAELAEMLFAGKSEKSSVAHQINDLDAIITQGEHEVEAVHVNSAMETLTLSNVSAHIPETTVTTEALTLEIKKGDWIALYGETGKGKTTLLNSLFYPEYRLKGTFTWNNDTEISHLPVPECVYVTQKAYLLTGTLRENFESYPDDEIVHALETVDLTSWYSNLPNGLDTWLGENGETLSGGQRKKLLLAQALLKRPQLLVVDEPTAGISADNAIAIFSNIKQHNPNITILMATHLLDFESVVDKVVRI
jgi:ATP-binding cassette subfamily C protein CydC